jgi:hypothetical protein
MLRPLFLVVLAAWGWASAGLSQGAGDCRSRGADIFGGSSAMRAVVVLAGEEDPAVTSGIAALNANTVATLHPPNPAAALSALSAGLRYLPRLSTREVDRLQTDPSYLASVRAIPGLFGFQYLDEDVQEGYTSAATQARAYATLKALFPAAVVLYATRLDPVATDPTYLDLYFRPEYTDLVTPYFYPVGTTALGTQEQSDAWEARLASLLASVRARTPGGKDVLPVLQGFEQTGHPVGAGFPLRQLAVYRELWPESPNVAAFWWGGPIAEPLLGLADRPVLRNAFQRIFGGAPARPAPCLLPPR